MNNNGARVYDGDNAAACYHELGHALSFRHYGYEVSSVEVGERSGRTVTEEAIDAFHLIVSLCAGKAAVDKWYGWKAPTDENWRKSGDHRKAFKAALEVSHGDYKAAGLLMQWAECVADAIVAENWNQFHEPAKVLAERGRLKVG